MSWLNASVGCGGRGWSGQLFSSWLYVEVGWWLVMGVPLGRWRIFGWYLRLFLAPRLWGERRTPPRRYLGQLRRPLPVLVPCQCSHRSFPVALDAAGTASQTYGPASQWQGHDDQVAGGASTRVAHALAPSLPMMRSSQLRQGLSGQQCRGVRQLIACRGCGAPAAGVSCASTAWRAGIRRARSASSGVAGTTCRSPRG